MLIGAQDTLLYRRAFGHRALTPEQLPMREDTIFDLASLTKVIATTTAVMQLTEQGKWRLDDLVAQYWPEFTTNGKGDITIRELLTHYSGLRADLDLQTPWWGYETALTLIVAEKPRFPAGTAFLYSDINFAILGELVRRVSGLPLDVYCARHIFQPLGMNDTSFVPPSDRRERIAPTERMQSGIVHDPTAYRMGGVAGHAGLFSTADDLAIFARMLLHGGSLHGVQIVGPQSVAATTSPQSPPHETRVRGLGWDIGVPFVENRNSQSPPYAYGHTGFTGTSMWIDPASQMYVIILTNRLHPHGTGDAQPLRKHVANVVAETRKSWSTAPVMAHHAALARGARPISRRAGTISALSSIVSELALCISLAWMG